ncbi:hypothetical protein [Bosea sp. 685]|uniref:hypothetical protein n=1 Tax=Bosea sp. 685 TaxID=3080057 RepID=UPI0028935954|nr:hypothetical protein [Bosea sp. 685]WNJ88739.1 hypothetical protein RMR04_20275 [Bosea sp. 685]
MTASIISFKDASTRLYRQAQLKREQELIEAAEAELDKAPVLSEQLIIRSLAHLRERDAGRDRDAP